MWLEGGRERPARQPEAERARMKKPSIDLRPEPGQAERRARRREYLRMLDYSVIGMVFPVATILGFFLGKWIGGWFGAPAGGGIIGGGLGVLAGFYNVYKMVVRLDRENPS
jgi:hypothetical protein